MNGILSSIVGANPSLVIITKDGTPMATLLPPAATQQPQPTAAQPSVQNPPVQSQPAQNPPVQSQPAQNPPAQSQPAQNPPVQSQPVQSQPAQNPPAQSQPAAVPSTGIPLYTTIMTIIGPWAPPQTGSPQQTAGASQVAAQNPPAPTQAASTKSTQTPYHRKTATGPGGELGGLLSTVLGGVEGIGQALGGAGGSQTAAPGPSIPASEIPPGFSLVPRAEPTPTSLLTVIRER